MLEERVIALEARVAKLELLWGKLDPHLPPEIREPAEEPRPVQGDDETPKQYRERLAAWDEARRPPPIENVPPVQGPDESDANFRARVDAWEAAHGAIAETEPDEPPPEPEPANEPPPGVGESFARPQPWR